MHAPQVVTGCPATCLLASDLGKLGMAQFMYIIHGLSLCVPEDGVWKTPKAGEVMRDFVAAASETMGQLASQALKDTELPGLSKLAAGLQDTGPLTRSMQHGLSQSLKRRPASWRKAPSKLRRAASQRLAAGKKQKTKTAQKKAAEKKKKGGLTSKHRAAGGTRAKAKPPVKAAAKGRAKQPKAKAKSQAKAKAKAKARAEACALANPERVLADVQDRAERFNKTLQEKSTLQGQQRVADRYAGVDARLKQQLKACLVRCAGFFG